MTNQMKKLFYIMLYVLIAVNVTLAIFVFIPPIGFNSYITYITFGFSILSCGLVTTVLILTNKRENEYLKILEIAKDIIKKRNLILYKFYVTNQIPFMYDKKGNLRDIDSLLGIRKEYDEKGRLVPTIYDLLKITPIFDKNGEEIPLVLVVKHFTKNIKINGLDKLPFPSTHFIRRTDEQSKEHERAISESLKAIGKMIDTGKPSSKKSPKLYNTQKGAVYNQPGYAGSSDKGGGEKSKSGGSKADDKKKDEKAPAPSPVENNERKEVNKLAPENETNAAIEEEKIIQPIEEEKIEETKPQEPVIEIYTE